MTPPPPKTGHRLWLAVTFASIALVGIVVVRLLPELERNLKNWATAGLAALGLLLLLIWFVFFTRLRWSLRLMGLVAVLLLAVGARSLVRVDGTADGTGRPRLAWRWSPKAELQVPNLKVDAAPVAPAPEARDVPQFFGPDRTGTVTGAALLPNWQTSPPKELWRHAVGAGWSAFAVVGPRAFTQEQRGEEESVTCYELTTGRMLWLHSNKAHFTEWQGGSGPRATPAIHSGRVYTIGGTGILNCLEAETGKLVWTRDVLKDYSLENITWGVSGSPLIVDDMVVVTGGKAPGPTLLAFKAASGEPVWQAGKDSASYASPMLATVADRRLILSLNADLFTAHDPATGKILLEHRWGDGIPAKAAQPVVVSSDEVFLSAGYGAGCVLLKIAPGTGDTLTAVEVWRNLKMKNQFNSVALRDGHLYGLDDGRLACMEAATGERKWKEGRFGSGQSLLVDDLVIVQSETGEVVLASANPEGYQELGRLDALDSKTWNHPVLAGRYLLVRNDREAICYELPVKR